MNLTSAVGSLLALVACGAQTATGVSDAGSQGQYDVSIEGATSLATSVGDEPSDGVADSPADLDAGRGDVTADGATTAPADAARDAARDPTGDSATCPPPAPDAAVFDEDAACSGNGYWYATRCGGVTRVAEDWNVDCYTITMFYADSGRIASVVTGCNGVDTCVALDPNFSPSTDCGDAGPWAGNLCDGGPAADY